MLKQKINMSYMLMAACVLVQSAVVGVQGSGLQETARATDQSSPTAPAVLGVPTTGEFPPPPTDTIAPNRAGRLLLPAATIGDTTPGAGHMNALGVLPHLPAATVPARVIGASLPEAQSPDAVQLELAVPPQQVMSTADVGVQPDPLQNPSEPQSSQSTIKMRGVCKLGCQLGLPGACAAAVTGCSAGAFAGGAVGAGTVLVAEHPKAQEMFLNCCKCTIERAAEAAKPAVTAAVTALSQVIQ